MASQEQIRQRCEHMHLAAIFRHSPQPRLLKAELLLHNPEGVLSFGTDMGLGYLDQVEQSSLRCVRQHATLPWPHGHTKLNRLALHLRPRGDSLVAGICINHCLLTVEQLGRCCEVVHVGRCGLHRVDQTALGINPDMDFHAVGAAFRAAVVPLVAFLGLVHFWISLALLVFRGGWSGDQGRINDRALLHGHASGLEVGFHRHKDSLAKIMFLQQVAEGQNRCLIWDPLAHHVDPSETSHDGHFDQGVFPGFKGSSQHPFF